MNPHQPEFIMGKLCKEEKDNFEVELCV